MSDRPTRVADMKTNIVRLLSENAKLKRERDEAREALSEIALYLSVGMGDETTTAQKYQQRILDGIKMLTEPIVDLWKQAEKERDEWAAMCGRYKQERDELLNEIKKLRLDAQREAEHHDRMVKELESLYDKLKS